MTQHTVIYSLREHPQQMTAVIAYFQQQWASEESMMVYDDALRRTPGAKNPLPQWYWLQDGADYRLRGADYERFYQPRRALSVAVRALYRPRLSPAGIGPPAD